MLNVTVSPQFGSPLPLLSPSITSDKLLPPVVVVPPPPFLPPPPAPFANVARLPPPSSEGVLLTVDGPTSTNEFDCPWELLQPTVPIVSAMTDARIANLLMIPLLRRPPSGRTYS